MKIRLFLVIGLLCLLASQAYALNFIGPPTAELNQGQYSVGYSYSYSEQDLDKTRRDFFSLSGGVITGSGEGQLKIEDLAVQRHYIGLNSGLSDGWEIYGRIGLSVAEADIDRLSGAQAGYDFEDDFTWGWGTKITFDKSDSICWGVSLHMNWLDTSTSESGWISGTGSIRDTVTLDTVYDILIAVGPTVDMGGWKLYGGPFYYDLEGDYFFERSFLDLNSSQREEAHIQEGSEFGAFIGAGVDLDDDSDITAELSFTSDGWGFGIGIAKEF